MDIFLCLKRLIFDLQQYSILFLALFSKTINKENFFLFTKIMGELLWKNQFLGL